MSKPPVPKVTTQVRLLDLVPTDTGLTTEELFEVALDAGLNVGLVRDRDELVQAIDGYSLYSTLRLMRRAGWLLYSKHTDPPTWKRTPTGTDRVNGVPRRPARMTATPRQEATA